MPQSIRVIAHIVARPGKENEAKNLLMELVEVTRTEVGCLRYDLLQSSVKPTDFVFVEEWESDAAFNQHMSSAHVQEAMLEAEQFLATPPDIQRYEQVL